MGSDQIKVARRYIARNNGYQPCIVNGPHSRHGNHWPPLIQQVPSTLKGVPLFCFNLIVAMTLQSTGVSSQEPKLEDYIQFSAEYQMENDRRGGVVLLTVAMVEGSCIYALKQSNQQVPVTSIRVESSDAFSIEEFIPAEKPVVKKNDPDFNADVGKHFGKTLFWARITLADGQPTADLTIDLSVNGSICTTDEMCFAIRDQRVPVRFGGFYEPK